MLPMQPGSTASHDAFEAPASLAELVGCLAMDQPRWWFCEQAGRLAQGSLGCDAAATYELAWEDDEPLLRPLGRRPRPDRHPRRLPFAALKLWQEAGEVQAPAVLADGTTLLAPVVVAGRVVAAMQLHRAAGWCPATRTEAAGIAAVLSAVWSLEEARAALQREREAHQRTARRLNPGPDEDREGQPGMSAAPTRLEASNAHQGGLARALAAAVADLRAEHPDRSIVASVAELPTVEADGDLLRRVFSTLLLAALENSAGPLKLSLHGRARADEVVLWWTDSSTQSCRDGLTVSQRYAETLLQRLGARVERSFSRDLTRYVLRLPLRYLQ